MALDSNMTQQGQSVGPAATQTAVMPPTNQLAMTSSAPLPYTTSGTSQAMASLDQVTGANSPYLANAHRRGLEVAATRGGINSSIAAGSSERAALEAAMPLVQQGLAIDQQRQDVVYQDWLSQQNFGRALFGQQFTSSLSMLNQIHQYALEDPELYTPEVVSGFSNFFQQNMNDTMQRYFGAARPSV